MNFILADQYPLIMLILTAAAILFVLQYRRNESRISFQKRVQWLKYAAYFALSLLIIGYGIRIILTFIFSIEYFKIKFSGGLLILYDPIVRLFYAFMILKIFKAGLIMLNNFSKARIFDAENLMAMSKVNQGIMKLLIVRIIANIGYCLCMMGIDFSSNHAYPSLYYSFDSVYGILSLFILMLVISVITVIYEKAAEQYNENCLIV
ncbi:hypothetical protein [Dielma fastidiosa]|uniref:hypothetical protein n=1 Tax=Dielma fastidiosa TaxID=1034346 RepID=UPI000E5140CD|nr:hypothetical protein [Dielma fastidiosa]RHN01366.1 hypothetical protein DWZ33_05075 [Dielma fastidiosa]